MNLSAELLVVAQTLEREHRDFMADVCRQAAKMLHTADCCDCGGPVLGRRSPRCPSCRHRHRTQYHAARHAARKTAI